MVLNESTIPDLLSGPVNIKWKGGAPVPVAAVGHTAVLFNGTIYVGGGKCDDIADMFRINIYHPDTNKWDDAIDTPHAGFALTVLLDKLIIVGGATSEGVTNKLLVLESGQWKDYTQMPTARAFASAISHQSIMIVMGGTKDFDHPLSTTELLYSTTGQWFKCDDLPQPLMCFQSAIVGDVLCTLGGGTSDNNDSKAVYAATLNGLSSHQLKWQQLADTPWAGSAAVNLNNKYLLAVGGYAQHDTVCVLKRENDPLFISTSWVPIGSLPNVHFGSSAIGLDNQVIVIGGYDLYDHEIATVTIGTFWYDYSNIVVYSYS